MSRLFLSFGVVCLTLFSGAAHGARLTCSKIGRVETGDLSLVRMEKCDRGEESSFLLPDSSPQGSDPTGSHKANLMLQTLLHAKVQQVPVTVYFREIPASISSTFRRVLISVELE